MIDTVAPGVVMIVTPGARPTVAMMTTVDRQGAGAAGRSADAPADAVGGRTRDRTHEGPRVCCPAGHSRLIPDGRAPSAPSPTERTGRSAREIRDHPGARPQRPATGQLTGGTLAKKPRT